VLAAVICAVMVTAAEPVLIPLLRRAAVDVPNARSSHSVPTPRGGGAPVAAGLVAAALLIHGTTAVMFAVAVAAFAIIGLADDLSGLPAGRRLGMQGLVSLGVAGVLVGRAGLPPAVMAASAVMLAVWLTGFVNAFNFMDGVNGISAAHALVGGAYYAWLGWVRPDTFGTVAGAAVAAGALAFLPWNAVRARVFLGDVGSYGLGVALALLAAQAIMRHIPPEAALAPLVLYLADTGWTLHPGPRADPRSPPDAHLPEAVRRGLVPSAGDGSDGGGDRGDLPGRDGQPHRPPGAAGGGRPGRRPVAGRVPALPGAAGPGRRAAPGRGDLT
jgi:UDP-GlcNAc:undecaprenyl-phosphate/decaprenyl-phosphate GlcNAc-1-phosphate transferase